MRRHNQNLVDKKSHSPAVILIGSTVIAVNEIWI